MLARATSHADLGHDDRARARRLRRADDTFTDMVRRSRSIVRSMESGATTPDDHIASVHSRARNGRGGIIVALAVKHGLYVVAVQIDEERGVIPRMIFARAGRAVVASARGKPRCVHPLDYWVE